MSSLVPIEWDIRTLPPAAYTIDYVIRTSKMPNRRWKLHPRHQRYDYTWKDEDRMLYIDSIEKDIAQVSTITLSERRDEDGNIEIFILDGGHRIDTIKRFYGELGEDKVFRDAYGRLYSDLDDHQKYMIDSKQVTIVTYLNLTPEQEDLIFMRINRNLALSPGETINAMKSIPICQVTHDLSVVYKNVMCSKTGIRNCGDGSRMDEKTYMFVLCVNFLMGKVEMYEKPGAQVIAAINKYKWIALPSDKEKAKLEKHMMTLFSLIDVEMTRKFRFYDILVAQWLILNRPQDILLYKRFMKVVYMQDSVWCRPWESAVKDDKDSTHGRINGIDSKNLNSRINFFYTNFVTSMK